MAPQLYKSECERCCLGEESGWTRKCSLVHKYNFDWLMNVLRQCSSIHRERDRISLNFAWHLCKHKNTVSTWKILLSQDEASRQPRAEYRIGLQTEINTLHPEVNCKPAPKSALYLLMWFAYHRLVPCQGLFDCGRWYKFCPPWYEAHGGIKLGQSEAGGEQQKRKKEGGVAFPHIPVIFWCGSSSGV